MTAMHARPYFLAAIVPSLGVALAQPAVAQLASPMRRAHHALVYDEARQQILLTGGSTPGEGGSCCIFFNDSWTFDGTRWTPLGESGVKMSGMRLVVDNARQVRSIGGYDGAPMGVLRTLDGTTWRTDVDQPELKAAEPGVAYDARRNRIVAFGGSTGRSSVVEGTWEYDGTAWQRREIATPPGRQAHMMTYDTKRARTVMFGGVRPGAEGQRGQVMPDLWEYDGNQWIERSVTGGPSPRHSAGVAYDSRRGRTIIYGGIDSTGIIGDTWAWDGATWTKLADGGPAKRVMGYIVYDPRRDRVVLFGGRLGWPNDAGDTWEFDGTQWRQVLPAAP
jgi:hypothetical protein